ncbi:hypothetical protein ACFOY8_15070 [Thalassospira xianhensis]|uniref:Uncharacterized protein n=1 Tax=Thalassospira xianhensis MCCC 1A02616 TaxID=1177929 RepID=A0A367UJN3_9PROT|nr:hypothetical protein [Thalassospira xianhensis]RCK07534.1 hypothetical protein TH5_00155 [Thalassospira xianhensis MCCC 1A02616]
MPLQTEKTYAETSRVQDMMLARGFEVYHSGGGCFHWSQDLSFGRYTLVNTDEDNPLDGSPEAKEWLFSVQTENENFIQVLELLSLEQIFELTSLAPTNIDDQYDCDDYDDAIALFDKLKLDISGSSAKP